MTRPPARTSRTALLFLVFQALYGLTSSGNVFRAPDEFETYFQTEHLVDAGDLSVPQTLAIKQRRIQNGRVVGQEAVFFGTFGADGKPYAPYGPLVAVLALPHHLAGRVVASIAGVPRAPLPGGIAWLMVVGGITMLATATAAALAVAGFYRAALAVGAGDRNALILALLLGGATVLWTYGTNFFSEAFQAAAFAWAAALLLERGAGRAAFATATMLVAIAGLTKVTGLLFAPAFVVAILTERRIEWSERAKGALAMSAALAATAGIHLAWNAWRFGSPLNFGYDWAETIPQLPARAFLLSDIPRGLVVLLATPGKSLLVWAPAVALSVFGIGAFWRSQRAAAIAVIVAGSTGLLFFAAYLFPEGGYSHGPRNLVPILPLLLLPAAAADISGRLRPLTVICAIAGFALALASTSVSYLDDQTIGADLEGGRANYYDRVIPPTGRAFNQYRLGYIPFAATFETFAPGGWLHSPVLGQGPDYFPLHLVQAQRQLPDGHAIPTWLVWSMPAAWITLLIGSAAALNKR